MTGKAAFDLYWRTVLAELSCPRLDRLLSLGKAEKERRQGELARIAEEATPILTGLDVNMAR